MEGEAFYSASIMKQYNEKQFSDILKENGYWKVRTTGSHSIYKNVEGNIISVPQSHNYCVLRRLIKENNLHEN